MGARETLLRRMERSGTTASISCGALGEVTVEALSLRDAALLSRRADGDRALLFAACRELQLLGEELRSKKQLFRPEEIMAYVSDEEAAEAASVIRQLSGWKEQVEPLAEAEMMLQDASAAPAASESSAADKEPLPPQTEAGAEIISVSQVYSASPAVPIRTAVTQSAGPAHTDMPSNAAFSAAGLSASPRPPRGRFSGTDAVVTAAQAEQTARFFVEGLRRAKQIR